MNDLRCPGCDAVRDSDDNFCRRCGRQITVNLPALATPRLPAEPAPALPPALVGSVAALAIGTGLEWLARRVASNAARGAARAAGRAIVRRDSAPRAQTPVQATVTDDSAVVIRETLYVRQVNLRR